MAPGCTRLVDMLALEGEQEPALNGRAAAACTGPGCAGRLVQPSSMVGSPRAFPAGLCCQHSHSHYCCSHLQPLLGADSSESHAWLAWLAPNHQAAFISSCYASVVVRAARAWQKHSWQRRKAPPGVNYPFCMEHSRRNSTLLLADTGKACSVGPTAVTA